MHILDSWKLINLLIMSVLEDLTFKHSAAKCRKLVPKSARKIFFRLTEAGVGRVFSLFLPTLRELLRKVRHGPSVIQNRSSPAFFLLPGQIAPHFTEVFQSLLGSLELVQHVTLLELLLLVVVGELAVSSAERKEIRGVTSIFFYVLLYQALVLVLWIHTECLQDQPLVVVVRPQVHLFPIGGGNLLPLQLRCYLVKSHKVYLLHWCDSYISLSGGIDHIGPIEHGKVKLS